MKIDRLETHDRYQHFVKSEFSISETCQNIINSRPFGEHPFYIFAHKRTLDNSERYAYWVQTGFSIPLEEIPAARLIWQPRLTKPKAQENSMLFKAYPGSDILKIIWMIPQRELWYMYEEGKMTENPTIFESIDMYKSNPRKLEERESDDLPDEVIEKIYEEISRAAVQRVK